MVFNSQLIHRAFPGNQKHICKLAVWRSEVFQGKGERKGGYRAGAHTLSYTPQTWGKAGTNIFLLRTRSPILSGTNVLHLQEPMSFAQEPMSYFSLQGSTREAPDGNWGNTRGIRKHCIQQSPTHCIPTKHTNSLRAFVYVY